MRLGEHGVASKCRENASLAKGLILGYVVKSDDKLRGSNPYTYNALSAQGTKAQLTNQDALPRIYDNLKRGREEGYS